MREKVSRQRIFSNLIWRFLERTGAQTVSFIVAIVLARILVPEDYGTIALITVFTNILNVFVDSGLGTALVQKKDADKIDFSTVFYTNVLFCIFLYVLIWGISPLIENFYEKNELTAVIRVLSITVIISGLKNVQQAYVSKNLQFKKFFFSTLAGTLLAAVVGIWMAYHGFGLWALVTQQLVNTSIDTIVLWVTVKWRPCFNFSFGRLKELFSYGWKLLVSALIETSYRNLRQLIIGKKYSSSELAFYNRGELFPNVIVSNINNSIDCVLFSAMSAEQDDKTCLKNMTRRAIKIGTFCIAPLMMGLAASAPGVVNLLLTDKWLPCVPFLRIFCVAYMFYPIHTANLSVIRALGRSDLFLKLEIIKKIFGFTVLISTMCFGVLVMACSVLVTDLLGQIINASPNKKILGYSYFEQIKDIFPGILIAVFMGLVIYFVNFLDFEDWFKLLVQIPLGTAIYVLGAKIFHLEAYEYMKDLFSEKFNGRRANI